jgi:hypothetical protein
MAADGIGFSMQQLLLQVTRSAHDLQQQLGQHERAVALADTLLGQAQALAARARLETLGPVAEQMGDAARAVDETARELHRVLDRLPRAHDAHADLAVQMAAIEQLLAAAPDDLAAELETLLDALPHPQRLRRQLAEHIDALAESAGPFVGPLGVQIARLRELATPALANGGATQMGAQPPGLLILRAIERLSDAARLLQPTAAGSAQRAPGKKAAAAALAIYEFALRLIGALCAEKLESDQRFQMVMTSSLAQYNAALNGAAPELDEPMHKGAVGGKRKAPAKTRGRQGAAKAAAAAAIVPVPMAAVAAAAAPIEPADGPQIAAPRKRGRAGAAQPRKAARADDGESPP